MSTPPDGQSPTMQMYLFRDSGGGTDLNGGDDASVVYHEYTHGLSSRLITFANGLAAVDSAQSGAMGEAWSDFYANELLNAEGVLPDTPAPAEVTTGNYVVGAGAQPCTPCGGCRQKLREFASGDVPIVVADADTVRGRYTLGELLPAGFGPEHLG